MSVARRTSSVWLLVSMIMAASYGSHASFAFAPARPKLAESPSSEGWAFASQGGGTAGQVGSDRLLNAAKEARNWLIYSGGYFSNRYSGLTQITPANVKNLEMKWMYQAAVAGGWQVTPLVVDGIMY